MRLSLALLALIALLAGIGNQETPPATPTPAPAPKSIDRASVGVLLIDAQPVFFKAMAGEEEPVMARIEQLLIQADIAALPFVTTFEVPVARNGALPERLENVFPRQGKRVEKHLFDATAKPEIREALQAMKVRQIVVAGAETDVCVMQTVFGLLAMGFEVFVLEDAVFSNEANVRPAFERMKAAGAVVTTFKSFYYELERGVGRNDLPAEWRGRIAEKQGVHRSPYELPPFLPKH